MEEDHDGIHTDETSTSPSKNTQDNDGEHQLEEQSIGEARDLAEPTEDNSKEEVHVQGSSKSEKDTDTGNNEGSSMSALAKKEERLKRLRELHLRRNEARKLNHAEVVEEDRRNKLPANWEARKRRLDWEIQEEEARKEAEAAGEDYNKIKLLETSASDMEKRERKKKKKNPDQGFAGFAEAQYRQYERLTRQMDPDMEAYERQKLEMGEDFFPGVNTLLHGSCKVSQAGVERMVSDLEKQIEKRAKYSRRRPFDSEADVDYINERNMKFNKKASRFYDQYTAEIKQNLERGTAV